MATTVNGYISRPDGSEDFLPHQDWVSMAELAQRYKNFIVGRRTYDINLTWTEADNLRNLRDMKKIVVSTKPNLQLLEGFKLVTSPQTALAELQDFETAFLIGGGTLNAAFAKQGLIDEIILNITPVIIGKGLKVFADEDLDLRLDLLDERRLTEGIIQQHFRVMK